MTGKYANMSSSQIPSDIHSKRGSTARRVQKRLDFSTEEEKRRTFSLSKCIQRYEGVGSKRKFSLPLISLQGGSNFTALFSDSERRNMKQNDLDFQKSAGTENSHHLEEMDS